MEQFIFREKTYLEKWITGSILSVPLHSMARTHYESCGDNGVPVTLDDFWIIGSTSSEIDIYAF